MKGYRSYTQGKQVQVESTEFHDAQLKFAKDEAAERMDQYAKPGTSAAERQGEAVYSSYPYSRYRSRRP